MTAKEASDKLRSERDSAFEQMGRAKKEREDAERAVANLRSSAAALASDRDTALSKLTTEHTSRETAEHRFQQLVADHKREMDDVRAQARQDVAAAEQRAHEAAALDRTRIQQVPSLPMMLDDFACP